MATAPAEVFKSTDRSWAYGYLHIELFELCSFFSQSAHFEVIDSFTKHYDSDKGGTPTYVEKRWKGDPVGDDDPSQPGYKVWESFDDLNEDNAWIVVKCQTEHPNLAVMGYADLPKWQCKFQIAGNAYYIADPSDPTGVKYPKNHNVNRILVHRFGPYGGWDKADVTPDFNPASPPASGDVSTENHKEYGGNGTASDNRWVMICLNGAFIRLTRYNDYRTYFHHINGMGGDVFPISTAHMPMPRAIYGNGAGNGEGTLAYVGDNSFLAEGSYRTGYIGPYESTDYPSGGIAFWDNNENLVQSGFSMVQRRHLRYHTLDNNSSPIKLDLFPVSPTPIEGNIGHWFTYPYARRSYGKGTMLLDSKQWLSVAVGWSPFFAWDGVSDIL